MEGNFNSKEFKAEYFFNQAGISNRHREKLPLHIDADGTDAKEFQRLSIIEKNIVDYVKEGKNLYIYSQNAGNGKTSWAYRLARSYILQVCEKHTLGTIVLFISVPKFLLDLKSNISQHSDYIQHIMDNVFTADLVIWDDIGSKMGTEFEVSNLLSIIDSRINTEKSNIYTSNLNQDELHIAIGDRLYSRIFNYSEKIQLFGSDKRGIFK